MCELVLRGIPMLIEDNELVIRSRAEVLDHSERYRSPMDVCGPVTLTLEKTKTAIEFG